MDYSDEPRLPRMAEEREILRKAEARRAEANQYRVSTTAPSGFEVKDSGARQSFPGGMVRDVTEGKIDYSLVLDGPMFKRWAEHLTKGAEKYDKRNWMKASGSEERERFKESALRHFLQWYWGHEDEDHASAVFFNMNGCEYMKGLPKPLNICKEPENGYDQKA